MNQKKYKKKISALLIAALVGTTVLPTLAAPPESAPISASADNSSETVRTPDATQTPDSTQTPGSTQAPDTTQTPAPSQTPAPQPLKLNANYYAMETKGEYQIVFTLMEELPAFDHLSFKAVFSGAVVDSAAFDSALLKDAQEEILRGKDYASYQLIRKTADKLSAKTRLCTLNVSAADKAPTQDTLKLEEFKLQKDGKDVAVIAPELTLQEGPIVPELSDEEQAVYDKIAALPQTAEISFYQKDGSLTSISDLNEQLKEAQSAYNSLSKTEKSNVQKVLEYNGLTHTVLDELSPILGSMNNARGLIEIADALKSMKEENALNYQFLAAVFEAKKGSVSLDGLPADSTVLKECLETLNTLENANAIINKAAEKADYEEKTYACEDQIKIIQRLSKHKYYNDYLTDLKSQIKDLSKDITNNYEGRDKETLLDLLDKAEATIKQIEQGADDLPTMSLKEIIYKRVYTIKFERRRTLADSQKASVTVVITDKNGEVLDESTKVFPNDSTNLSISMTASYPAKETVTVTATYTLDGAEFLIAEKDYKCSVTTPNNPAAGLPTGGNGGTGGTGNTGTGNGGTIFPSDKPEPTEKPQSEELFEDLGNYDWAKDAIEGLYYAGIVNGMEEGIFNPAGQVTREQFSKMVVQLFSVATGGTRTGFVDVDEDAWYAPYITAALQAGYIQGQSTEYFGIGESIMRQDMATILYRALGDNNSKAVLNFTDADAIAPYAEDAVAELVGLKVINGYEDGSFKPRGTATRAEAAKMIWGVYQFLNEDSEE